MLHAITLGPLGTEWVQQVGSWTATPSLRYTTQSAADFYYGPPFPSGFVPGQPYSADQRLSAFGAITPGIKVAKAFPYGWKVDLKAEYYEQKGSWRTLIGSDNRPIGKPEKITLRERSRRVFVCFIVEVSHSICEARNKSLR